MGRKLQNRKKYLGFLALVMVLSLSILGAGYAQWHDETKLDAIFEMADFQQDIEVRFFNNDFGGVKSIDPSQVSGKDDAEIDVSCETVVYPGPFDLQAEITNPADAGIPIRYHFEKRDNGGLEINLVNPGDSWSSWRYLIPGRSRTHHIIIGPNHPDEYEFQLALVIEQFNGQGWEREILINGDFNLGTLLQQLE
ncbi:MAG: hypothetical protein ACOWWO_17090 [Peptococcaceae bacterium]